MLSGNASTKNSKVRAHAICSSWVEVAAETRKTARHGIYRKKATDAIPETTLTPESAQKADEVYCWAPTWSSLPLASARTLTSAFPARPKSVIDIQVIRLLMVSHTPYRSAPR